MSSPPTEEELKADAQRYEQDPAFRALLAQAEQEISATGTINPDTFAALMGAEPLTNPTPRQAAILGAVPPCLA
jgi:hypothetical protein